MNTFKKRLKKATSFLVSALLLTSVFSTSAVLNVSAVSYSEMSALDQYAYSGNDLGAVYTKSATTFKVWAPTASAVQIKRYTTGSDTEAGAAVIEAKDMTKGSNGVWSISISGDLAGTYYTYLVTANGTTHETVDIYARSTGVNGMRGMVLDLDSTDPAGWSSDKRVKCTNQTDSVIWEVHVKDFSSASDSGMTNKGKYLAFTETGTTVNGDGVHPTGIDYLEDLGVTHVHLLPVYDYASVDETSSNADLFNWGYDPMNYNTPEGSYSTNPYDGSVRVKEFKQMVQALHNKGIGVVMDVVYNHTNYGGSGKNDWFDFTVPGYYYRQNSKGTYANGSGCGNETASDRAMYRKFMIDSLTYWATEYHLDGFRFDLMGIHDVDTMNAIRAALDEIDPEILIYGEPWAAEAPACPKATATQGNMSQVSAEIAAFNDKVRDAIKGSCFNAADPGFIQGAGFEDALKGSIQANSTTMSGDNKWSKQPSQTVTYTSAHDNYTLYDKLVKSCKGGSGYGNRYDDLVAMNKLAGGIILTSQGMSFFQAGEEFARSKFGDENSYKSSASINQLKWSNTITYADIVSYYKGLIEIRKAYSPFRDPTNTSNSAIYFGWGDNFPKNVVAFTMNNKLNPTSEWNYVAVIHNANSSSVSVTLQGYSTLPTQWVIIADGTNAGTKSLGTSGSTVNVPGRSTMVLVDKESFDSTNLSSKCTVTVNHVMKSTGQTYKVETLKGNEGASYTTSPLAELTSQGYTVASVTGQTTGTFSKAGASVTYLYELDDSKYGTVTVKYVDADTLQSIKSDDVHTGLIDSSFSFTAPTIKGYEAPSGAQTGTYKATAQTITFKYTKQEESGLKIHYYNSSGWSEVNMYVYTGSASTATQLTGAWPGTRMNSDGNGWFSGTVEGVDSARFIANAGYGMPQDPAGDKPDGYLVSGESWVKGSQVYPTGKVIVTHTDTNGTVLAKETLTGMADGTNTYTTSSKTIDGYELKTAPANASGKFTSADITVNYIYQRTDDPEPLALTASLSASTITEGSSVTITASASGGKEPYTYQMKAKLSSASSYTTIRDYGSAASATWKPDAAGTYSVVVTAKDSQSATKSKTLTLTVDPRSDELKNTSKIAADTINLGESVKLTGSSTGGVGTKQYGFFYKKAGTSSFVTIRTYGTGTTVTFTPKEEGTYTVRINVKDEDSNIARKDFTLTVNKPADELKNTSKIAAETIALGDSVKLTGSSTGGVGTKLYGFFYQKSGASGFTTIRAYATGTTATFTPSESGTYTVRINVKDEEGTIVRKNFTLTVNAPLKNTSKMAASTIVVGSGVKLTGASTGGVGTKQYGFFYQKSGASGFTTIRGYATGTTVTFTPKEKGTYTVRINVKDSTGTIVRKNFTLTVNKALKNTSTLSATSVTLTKSVKVNCSSTGGSGTKLYAVWYKNSNQSTWTRARNYATGTTVTITPNHAGTYTVSVKVKDADDTVVTKRISFKVVSNLANTSVITSGNTAAVGTEVVVKASSTGGTGTKKYAAWYKRSTVSSWTLQKDYSTATTIKVTPKYKGEYTIRVKVKDGDGTIKSKDLTFTSVAALKNTSTLSPTSLILGSGTKVTCSSTGGVGTVQYAVWYKNKNQSSWTQGRDYSTGTSVTVKPKHTGTYTVRVKAKDSNGTIVNKDLSLTVKAEPLENTTTVSTTTLDKGSALKISCSSTGGTGTKTYAVWYKRASASDWTQKQDYSTNTSISLTLKHVETYYISVKVKDSSDTVVKKKFTINVIDPNAVKAACTISATSVSAGSSLTVTTGAESGTAPYTYSVSKMIVGDGTWTAVKTDTTAATVKVSFPEQATYQVRVIVKDSSGTTATQYFTVTAK